MNGSVIDQNWKVPIMYRAAKSDVNACRELLRSDFKMSLSNKQALQIKEIHLLGTLECFAKDC